jgi:hypothetical protein
LGIAFKPLDLDVGLGTAFARHRDQTRRRVQAPVPQATSSTFIPGSMPAPRTMTSPMEVTFSATAGSRRFPHVVGIDTGGTVLAVLLAGFVAGQFF